MTVRPTAIEEITRFWLQTRNGCLVDRVALTRLIYDGDVLHLVALKPNLQPFLLPTGETVGPRLVVELNNRHLYLKYFGLRDMLKRNLRRMGEEGYITARKKSDFVVFRQHAFEQVKTYYETEDFDRILVFRAFDVSLINILYTELLKHRIHIVTINNMKSDLHEWYDAHPQKYLLSDTLFGDIFHNLISHFNVRPDYGEDDP